MKKLFLLLFLISFPFYYCIAQIDSNVSNDSVNAAAKKINDSIDLASQKINDSIYTATKKINDSLNAIAPRIEHNIKESVNAFIPPKPFMPVYDTSNIFDSLHGKLTVIVKNIGKVIGNLNVALFNNYISFMNNGPFFRGASMPINDFTMSVAFDSIPKGIYSVAVFHDEDKNGLMAKNQLNIPMEGYGFSNNVAVSFGPPNYNQTKFYYSGKNKTIIVFMTYFKFPK